MSKPTPGTTYTVRSGDTIRGISRRAYGNDQSGLIIEENPRVYNVNTGKSRILTNGGVSPEGLPYIYAGDILDIPATTNRYDDRPITADFDSEFSVKINDREFHGVKASGITRAVNTISDSFIFEIPFDYTDRALVDALRPYSYQPVTLYVGREPYITGQVMRVAPTLAAGSTTVQVDCRTRPGDMIECMASREALEYTEKSLLYIGEDIAGRYNLRAFTTHPEADSALFAQAIKEVTETDFEFLARLAGQKGYLITSSKDGNLLFTRAATDARPVASLRAGEYPVEEIGGIYDGSKRFSSFFAYAEVGGSPTATAHLRDASISDKVKRPFAFSADESEADTIDTAVAWKAGTAIASATRITATVAGYRNPDGALWEENTKVSVLAPHIFLFKETDFITQIVRFEKAEAGGDITRMTLVLPETYNGQIPDSFPWEGYAT